MLIKFSRYTLNIKLQHEFVEFFLLIRFIENYNNNKTNSSIMCHQKSQGIVKDNAPPESTKNAEEPPNRPFGGWLKVLLNDLLLRHFAINSTFPIPPNSDKGLFGMEGLFDPELKVFPGLI